MDRNAASKADVIHDLDVRPWPFADSTFEHIRAENVLEHVADFISVMEEISRVARPNATVDVQMPFMSSCNFATDPTHRRAGTARTFEYFDPNQALGKLSYSEARFEVLEFHYSRGYLGDVGRMLRVVDKVVIPIIERHYHEYEHYFAYLYPMHEIRYLLRVVK
ncbi:MAG: hypothetical protein NVS3B20_09570 [Polyangiales bacterium]